MARLLFVIGLLAACDPPAAPPPPETELVLDDEGARVRVTLVDGGGLTDRVVDYDVTIEMGGVTRSVLHGTAQAQSVAHRTRAHRLGAMIAIALGDALCLVDAAGAPLCLDLSEVDSETSAIGPFADAIAWRAGDASGDDRAVASIALAWVDRIRGCVALHDVDGVSDAERLELDAALARCAR